jgi:riboflavin kinase / FMN adenylyltransferase
VYSRGWAGGGRRYPCPMSSPGTPTALSIGNFDGVHVGHAALIRRARDQVGTAGRVVALVFDPHPMAVLRPQAVPPRLSTLAQRAGWLRSAGADEVEHLEPTPELLGLTPEAFVRAKVERNALPPGRSWFVEGADFHFGKGRAGSMETLAALGRSMGFVAETVAPVDAVLDNHQVARASSTLVRWLLSLGRVRDAAIVLGRPYELTGTVVRGDQRGRTIGWPTANIDAEQMLPADGVYAGRATLPGGATFPAAVNVGSRPTFNGRGRRLEAHVITGGGWPALAEYGWAIRLELLGWVRDDVRFGGVAELVGQIGRDCERTVEIAGGAGAALP